MNAAFPEELIKLLGNKDIRGKGYGCDAIMATMRYAFDELHLMRLDGGMIEYNIPSYHLYCEKLGWTQEGRQRQWYYTKGQYFDRILVGITRQDYLELLDRMK